MKYHDRHADERLIVYYLRRCSIPKLARILTKVGQVRIGDAIDNSGLFNPKETK